MLPFQHLADEPVLNVDAEGAGSSQVSDELFVGRWGLEWIH